MRDGHGSLGRLADSRPEALDGDLDFRGMTGCPRRTKVSANRPSSGAARMRGWVRHAPSNAADLAKIGPLYLAGLLVHGAIWLYPADNVKYFAVHFYARLGNDEVEHLRLPAELEDVRVAQVVAVDLPRERPMPAHDEVVQIRPHVDVRPLA